MGRTRIVRVRENILEENRIEASALRARLTGQGVKLVNLMSSPGSGKTSLILQTVKALRDRFDIAVIEADMDSTVDADKMTAIGIQAVQIETGGFCHVDAAMAGAALAELELAQSARADAGLNAPRLLFLENVGNLICTAQHDTGAHVNVAILSVPEGDDKPLKYPLMFTRVDAVVINKTDFLPLTDFDVGAVTARVRVLNPNAVILPVSCATGDGLPAWLSWIGGAIRS